MTEVNITLREIQGDEASAVKELLRIVSLETDYLTMSEAELQLTEELLAIQLEGIHQSDTQLLLGAFADERLIGLVSVKSDDCESIAHIGEVGISILKEYWGMGLGQLLLEEVIYWSEAVGQLCRLELRVQVRNERAVALYKKMGFVIEATLKRGARDESGEFIDVYLMSLLVN